MNIFDAGQRPTRPAPSEFFTGSVLQDPILDTADPARVRSVKVTFAPSARTNWHTHPLGQTLFILAGIGRVQAEGGPVHEVREGDVVWFAPGEKHWHGAAPDHAMVHIAIQEHQDGTHVTWLEPVSDQDYSASL